MTVGVIFGGKSCEHNVSIVTGVQTLSELPSKYKAVPIYIDESGVWHNGKELGDIEYYSKRKDTCKEVHLRPSSPYLYAKNGRKLYKIDCMIVCCHGVNGEDGSLQGLLQLSGIPYTGSGVLASAAGLDKSVMKRLFKEAGLPVVPFVTVSADEYVSDPYAALEAIKSTLSYPLIVKPCNLGSSIGIGIARDLSDLFTCLRAALEWDTKAVVEHALEDFEEYNCAVLLGKPSEVEKPVGWKDYLTYEDKYLSKSEGVGREFPAKIPSELSDEIKSLAVKAYDAIGADGVARVDFLYKDGELFVNEINTVPGSLSSYLFKGGLKEVADKIIERAVVVNSAKRRLKYAYKPFRGERGIKK